MLSLRPYDPNIDFSDIYRCTSDPVAMRYIRMADTEEQTARSRMQQMLDYRALNPGFGVYMLDDTNLGKNIGNMIIRHANWDNTREMEIGYVLDPQYWGQGYGTQAVALMKQLAIKEHQSRFLVAFTEEGNIGSNRVLEKSGFVLKGHEYIYDENCLRWEWTAAEDVQK